MTSGVESRILLSKGLYDQLPDPLALRLLILEQRSGRELCRPKVLISWTMILIDCDAQCALF